MLNLGSVPDTSKTAFLLDRALQTLGMFFLLSITQTLATNWGVAKRSVLCLLTYVINRKINRYSGNEPERENLPDCKPLHSFHLFLVLSFVAFYFS